MGKMALLLVMGVMVTLGIIGYVLNSMESSMMERVTGFQKYTTARNIAHTGINMVLRGLDRNDTTLITPLNQGKTAYMTVATMEGVCSLSLKQTNAVAKDTVNLTSRSTFMDTGYTMKVRLRRYPKPFPGVNGAVMLASSGIDFAMDGNPRIYGQNYNMNGTRGDAALDTLGVAVKTSADSADVAAYSALINGDPNKVKVEPPDDPGAYVQEYINGADIVFPDGSNNSGIYGSPTVPVIGFASGSVKFGGTGKFYGVLVVNGTVDFNGTFDIYGLVLCYGTNVQIEVSTSVGTPHLFGAIIMTGAPGSKFTMKGTADFYYSVEALEMARYITKMQAYKVLSWYE